MEVSLKMIIFISCFLVILTRCRSQELFSVRLVNATDPATTDGRIEVYYKGQWGIICAERWDFFDALVACRQLGFNWVDQSGVGVDRGRGDGPAWLGNVECVGSEISLEECSNDGWVEHGCIRAASMWCTYTAPHLDIQFFNYIRYATEGGIVIRPYPGSHPFLICDQGWDKADADVICRQKGFPSASRSTSRSYFGEHPPHLGPLKYLAVGLGCNGDESSIVECQADLWFTDQCPPGHEAGVVCNIREEPEGFQVRLVNGNKQYEGLVEIFYNGIWVSIYEESGSGDDFFERRQQFSTGTVVCRQLGFGYLMDVTSDDRFDEIQNAVPITIEGMRCSGDEESLAQCGFDDIEALDSSTTSVPLGFICSGPLPDGRNPIRFAYPEVETAKHAGRSTYLEIFHEGKWGTICNTGWTAENSRVACRELGYSDIWYDEQNGLGSSGSGYKGPVLQEGIVCEGDEDTLDQCRLGTWYQHSCSHAQDVNIGCSKYIEDVKYAEVSTPHLTTAAAVAHEGLTSNQIIMVSLLSLLLQGGVHPW